MIYIKIVLDAFGGDFSPNNVLKGSILAKEEIKDLEIILSGNKNKLKETASKIGINLNQFEIIDAKNIISTEENPTKIIKEKNESSMAIGLKTLNEKNIDAFITAGSTGALTVGSFYYNEKIKNVKRAAICPIMPSYDGEFLLLDAGANLNCRADVLLQFAIMGDIYSRKILKINNPRVGLANVGIEETKGPKSHKEAYNLLKNQKTLNFIGNIEARYVPLGKCDVVVCDGFSGNMILKTMEGTAKCIMKILKDCYSSNLKTKLAAIMLYKEHKKIKYKLNYKNYGGAILLGMEKPIIKAHGNSNEETIKNAILIAVSYVKNNITEEIAKNIVI